MNRCKRCKVDVMDDVDVCPLCDTVLTKGEEEPETTYPNIRNKTKFLKRMVTIACYFLVVLEIVFCIINYYTFEESRWSLITGVCIAYTIFTLYYSFNRRNGHIRKIFVQIAGAIVLLLALDIVTGAQGWSVQYGLPCTILLLNCILVACMLVNFDNWQSYLLVQLFSVIVSLVLLILYFCNVTKSPILPWTSFGTSAVIFSFCLSIGHRKAKNELRRRFFI